MELEELAEPERLPAEIVDDFKLNVALETDPFELEADRDDSPSWVDAYEM